MKTYQKLTALALTCSLCALPAALRAGTDGEKHFKMMDADGDGKVSRTEHAAAAKKMFGQCDANRDGIVTAAEMDASMAKLGEKPAADDKNSTEKIAVIDKNGDGKLTATEHEAGTEMMFGKMDLNGDGFLSKEECEAGMRMMKKGSGS